MKWFADMKARRADKAAKMAHAIALSSWQMDLAILEKIIAAITAASNGEDTVPNTMMQKSGEHTLWSGPAIFHEAGRTPSQYSGTSTGFSIPIAAGIRFRVGAQQGNINPGIELQMDKDQGLIILTTERLVFVGPIKTQEWNFDKLLMLSTNEDESDYFINVSNRQKTSGVRLDPTTGREFNRFLGSAFAAHESGYEAVLEELANLKAQALKEEPHLSLPSPNL